MAVSALSASLFVVLLAVMNAPRTLHALSCYQGLSNISSPLNGSPAQCPGVALACTKTVDIRSGQITRGCQATNCTMSQLMDQTNTMANNQQQQQQQQQAASNSQQMSATGGCSNNTMGGTFCCCYGEGCNSAPGGMTATVSLLGTVALMVVGSLVY